MKNALILHGTNGSPERNWFPWLKERLEEKGWKVWVPELPGADRPDIDRYNDFLLSSGWVFDSESVIIGHSSGAMEILGLLPALPEGVKIKQAILVGSFIDALGRDDLLALFKKPFDFEAIKSRARETIFVHSDDDPVCPLEGAKKLAALAGGEMIVLSGHGHFSASNGQSHNLQFPLLLELLERP